MSPVVLTIPVYSSSSCLLPPTNRPSVCSSCVRIAPVGQERFKHRTGHRHRRAAGRTLEHQLIRTKTTRHSQSCAYVMLVPSLSWQSIERSGGRKKKRRFAHLLLSEDDLPAESETRRLSIQLSALVASNHFPRQAQDEHKKRSRKRGMLSAPHHRNAVGQAAIAVFLLSTTTAATATATAAPARSAERPQPLHVRRLAGAASAAQRKL